MSNNSNSLSIKDKIVEIRQRLGLSQDALADIAGVSGSAIGLIEQGKTKNPGADLLVGLASKLGISLEWLLLDEGEMLRKVLPPPTAEAAQTIYAYAAPPPEAAPAPSSRSAPGTHLGKAVPTFRLQPAAAPELQGLDLLKQVAKNGRDIARLQQALETVVAELRERSKSD